MINCVGHFLRRVDYFGTLVPNIGSWISHSRVDLVKITNIVWNVASIIWTSFVFFWFMGFCFVPPLWALTTFTPQVHVLICYIVTSYISTYKNVTEGGNKLGVQKDKIKLSKFHPWLQQKLLVILKPPDLMFQMSFFDFL